MTTTSDESLSLSFETQLSSINSLIISQDHVGCWTDDLPVCQYSGIGTCTNQIYRGNGFRREGHEFEDRSFHFRMDNDICLYGVFDGTGGSKVAAYVAQNFPGEILLGQLANRKSDDDFKDVLRQACVAVEKSYFETVDSLIAERIGLIQQISENNPEVSKRLKEIDAELNEGTAVLVALIINNRLYVANIGHCRALLCKRGTDGYLRVVQLTADHNLENANEISRLAGIGIDVNKVQQARKLAGRFYTRSIGDVLIKQEYHKMDLLSSAKSCPIISEPEVFGGFEIDASCCFLAMMSDGLYRTVHDAIGLESHVNAEIIGKIAAQFKSQSTYRDVAQAAVDQVVREHYRAFESSQSSTRSRAHDDITLIVRGFSYPLARPSADFRTPPAPTSRSGSVSMAPLSISIPLLGPSSASESPPRPFFGNVMPLPRSTNYGDRSLSSAAAGDDDNSPSFDETNTHSMEETARAVAALDLDESGRVASYVDFSEFDAAVDQMNEAERQALFAELEPRPDFEPIPEERELQCVG